MHISLVSNAIPTSYEHFAESCLLEAFSRSDISCNLKSILDHNFFPDLMSEPPTYTLALKHISFSHDSCLLCDILKLPHIQWEKDFIGEALFYLNSPFATLLTSDREFAKRSHSLQFLPHGIAEDLRVTPKQERPYDVVCIGDLADLSLFERKWDEDLPSAEATFLKDLCSFAQKERLYNAFEVAARVQNEHTCSYFVILELERYLKARRLLEAIESIEQGRIDIYGWHQGENWLLKLKNRERVYMHNWLPFTECLTLFSRAKIVLIDGCDAIDGADSWFLHALACGAMPLIRETPYLQETFGEAPFFYPKEAGHHLNEKVTFFLQQKYEREKWVSLMQKRLEIFSWEKQAKELINMIEN